MSRVCEITGKKPAVANNVSHANNRTKRRQLPNLQVRTFMSEILNKAVKLRVSVKAIRTIDKHHGLDSFMLNSKSRHAENFSADAQKVRRQIKKAAAAEK